MADSSKTGGSPNTDELTKLKKLILGEEQDRLRKLDQRISDLESRTTDVAEVLPQAIDRLIHDPVSKSAIERPIVDTIRGAIKRDTRSFAEALFPVLGPAIRRAVADSLKSLVQRINVALENSFTVRGLRWRLESVRSGVPFAQIILKHTMVYAVQEVFLIQRKSGLVLAGERRDEALALDEDAVSSMLTAIQSFIQDSLGMPNDEPLRSAELGDRTLWVINGPEALLACVISGSPPRSVRDDLMNLLETMHARFGDRFHEHPEILAGNEGLKSLLNEALREEVDEEAGSRKQGKRRLYWGFAGIVLFVYLAMSSWRAWEFRKLERELVGLFGSEPGYVLTGHGKTDGRLHLSALRDPLAPDPEIILEQAGIEVVSVSFDLYPYQSLDNQMIIQRLRKSMDLGDAAELRLDGGQLQVSGQLLADQFSALEKLPGSHPVINAVSLLQARLTAEEAGALLRTEFGAPDTVSAVASGDQLSLVGLASPEWFSKFRGTTSVGGWPLDFTALEASLQAQLKELAEDVQGRSIRFSRRYEIDISAAAELDVIADAMNRIQVLGKVLARPVAIRLIGFSDGTGTREQNEETSLMRARMALQALAEHGVDTAEIHISAATWVPGGKDPDLRKVGIRIEGLATP